MGKCLSCFKATDTQNQHQKQPPANPASKSEPTLSTTECSSIGHSHNINTKTFNCDNFVEGGSGEPVQQVPKSIVVVPEKKFMIPASFPTIRTIKADAKVSGLGSREVSESKICSLFEKYKDSSEDAILSEGIEHLCQHLGVKPEEFKVLLLAWKFHVEQMCRFTRKEFVDGCKLLKMDSISSIQHRLLDLVQEVQNDESFKGLYRFTYKFGLETGQRILPAEMAIQLWKLVFSQREPPILRRWLVFLEKHPHVRGIPRDTWNMFLNFADTVGSDLSNYDDTEAWPCLFDDFVEYENDQINQNVLHQSKEEIDMCR